MAEKNNSFDSRRSAINPPIVNDKKVILSYIRKVTDRTSNILKQRNVWAHHEDIELTNLSQRQA